MNYVCLQCGRELPAGWTAMCARCALAEVLATPEDPNAPKFPAPLALKEGTRFGSYELLEEIGRGGMGRVFRARQTKLRREVALKVILAGHLASSEVVRRFKVEAEAAAALDHPNIVPVYEVGEEQDHYFLAMKLIEGTSLAECLAPATGRVRQSGNAVHRSIFPSRQLAELVSTIARAVQHAHSRGVLHRDLKPGNILLDRMGAPHLADFGLARLAEGDGTITATGAAVGTPLYMAPEQALGQVHAISTAADIWSLGAILYELLTGAPPFLGATHSEILRLVVEAEPTAPHLLVPDADPDLETIALHCLQKDPARRYPTAAALADDLDRWARGEAISVRPISRLERAWRWSCKRPALVSAIGIAGVALAALGWGVATAIVSKRLDEQRRLFNYIADMNLAGQAWIDGNVGYSMELLQRHGSSNPEESNLRGPEWFLLDQLGTGQQARVLLRQNDPIRSISASPDGSRLAFVGANGAGLLNVREAQLSSSWNLNGATADTCEFHPDGQSVFLAGGNGVWQCVPSNLTPSRVVTNAANRLKFGFEGRMLAAGWLPDGSDDEETAAFVIDTQSASVRTANPPHTPVSFHWPGIHSLAFLDHWGVPFRWDFAAGIGSRDATTNLAKFPRMEATTSTWSRDGAWIARANWLGNLELILMPTGRVMRSISSYAPRAVGLEFSPDGQWLAVSGGAVPRIDLYHGTNWTLTAQLKGHTKEVTGLEFSPDSARLWSSSKDGTIREWLVGEVPSEPAWAIPHQVNGFEPRGPVFAPDGNSFAISTIYRTGEEAFGVFDMNLRKRVSQSPGRAMAFSPDSAQVLSWVRGEGLAISDRFGNRLSKRTDLNRGSHESEDQLSADGTLILVRDTNGVFHVHQAHNGNRLATAQSQAYVGMFSPNSRSVALLTAESNVELWDWRSGTVRRVFTNGVAMSLAFSPHGEQLAVGTTDWEIHTFDLATGRQTEPLRGHQGGVAAIAYSPDGRTLVSGGDDRVLRFWNLATRREALILAVPELVYWLAFSPDGSWLLSGGICMSNRPGDMGSYRVWKLHAGAQTSRSTGETKASTPPPGEAGARTIWESGPGESLRRP